MTVGLFNVLMMPICLIIPFLTVVKSFAKEVTSKKKPEQAANTLEQPRDTPEPARTTRNNLHQTGTTRQSLPLNEALNVAHVSFFRNISYC